jgi:hypothetical protein
VNTKVVITAEDQTGAGIASVKSSMAGLGAAIGAVSSVTTKLIDTLGEVARATIGLYKEQIKVSDSMDEMSVRMAMSIKDLVAFQAASEMNGTSLEAMAAGTRMLAKHMSEHGEALKKAGVTSRDANEAFMQLADLFKGMTDPMQRLDLATRIFGRGVGQQLLPVLVQGSEELKKIREATDGYGEALTRLSPEAQKLNDTLYLMGINFKQAAAEGVFPLVKALNDEMLPALREVAKEGSLLKTLWIGFGGVMKISFTDPWNQTLLGAKATLQQFMADVETMLAKMTFGKVSELHLREAQRMGEAAKKTLAEAAGNAAPKPSGTAPALMLPGANTNVEAAALAESLRRKGSNGGKSATKADPFDALMRGIDQRGAALAADGQQTEKLTATQQYALKLMADLQNGTLKLNEAQKILLATRLENILAMDKENQEADVAAKQTAMVTKATADNNKALDQQADKIKDTIDPLRVLAREIENINTLRAAGRLTAEEAADAENRLVAEFAKSRDAMADMGAAGKGAFADITDAIENFGNKAADTFADFVMGGKASFSDLINSMLRDILRLQAKQTFDPITRGAGDWLSKLFNPSAGGAGSMSGNGSVQGNANYIWDLHSGGIAGAGEGSGQHLRNLALFAGAPKYHGGGLAGDEMPAVLKRGEGVFTPGQMKALGGGGANVVVNVINQTSAPVSAQTQGRPKFDGESWVVSVVLNNIRNGGPLRNAMGGA